MKEWRARPKNKGGNQREAAVMMMGLYDVKVLMGISAAGLKEQSRCMCVRLSVVCVYVWERVRLGQREHLCPFFAILSLRNSNCDPCSVKICSPLGLALSHHTHTHQWRHHTRTSPVTLPALAPFLFSSSTSGSLLVWSLQGKAG